MTKLKNIIDCATQPFIPEGWSVESHDTSLGQWEWEVPSLYLSEKQKGDKYIVGNDLRKELKSQPVLPANVLDYLLANPYLIPEDWKGKAVFFWGTIYRDSDDLLYVRYLCWYGSGWGWNYDWLGNGFYSSNPALVRALALSSESLPSLTLSSLSARVEKIESWMKDEESKRPMTTPSVSA